MGRGPEQWKETILRKPGVQNKMAFLSDPETIKNKFIEFRASFLYFFEDVGVYKEGLYVTTSLPPKYSLNPFVIAGIRLFVHKELIEKLKGLPIENDILTNINDHASLTRLIKNNNGTFALRVDPATPTHVATLLGEKKEADPFDIKIYLS